MTQAINPNTILPTSLQVDKIAQSKQMHNAGQQGLLIQEKELNDRKKQTRVNTNEKTEKGKIRDNNNKNNSSQKKGRNDEEDNAEENSSEDKKLLLKRKGVYIDIKV